MSERNFNSFTTQVANEGAIVHPCGRQATGAACFSAEALRGINSYDETLTGPKKAGTRSSAVFNKTSNGR